MGSDGWVGGWMNGWMGGLRKCPEVCWHHGYGYEGLGSLSQEKLCLSPNRFSVLSMFSVPALLNKPAM